MSIVDARAWSLPFDYGPIRLRGIRREGWLQGTPTDEFERQFITTNIATYGNATTVMFRLQSLAMGYALLLILRCQAQAKCCTVGIPCTVR